MVLIPIFHGSIPSLFGWFNSHPKPPHLQGFPKPKMHPAEAPPADRSAPPPWPGSRRPATVRASDLGGNPTGVPWMPWLPGPFSHVLMGFNGDSMGFNGI